jgi:hypothetical protein
MPEQVTVVHIAVLYDAVCHSCGWEAPSNPDPDLAAAQAAADAHVCPEVQGG